MLIDKLENKLSNHKYYKKLKSIDQEISYIVTIDYYIKSSNLYGKIIALCPIWNRVKILHHIKITVLTKFFCGNNKGSSALCGFKA